MVGGTPSSESTLTAAIAGISFAADLLLYFSDVSRSFLIGRCLNGAVPCRSLHCCASEPYMGSYTSL